METIVVKTTVDGKEYYGKKEVDVDGMLASKSDTEIRALARRMLVTDLSNTLRRQLKDKVLVSLGRKTASSAGKSKEIPAEALEL